MPTKIFELKRIYEEIKFIKNFYKRIPWNILFKIFPFRNYVINLDSLENKIISWKFMIFKRVFCWLNFLMTVFLKDALNFPNFFFMADKFLFKLSFLKLSRKFQIFIVWNLFSTPTDNLKFVCCRMNAPIAVIDSQMTASINITFPPNQLTYSTLSITVRRTTSTWAI